MLHYIELSREVVYKRLLYGDTIIAILLSQFNFLENKIVLLQQLSDEEAIDIIFNKDKYPDVAFYVPK